MGKGWLIGAIAMAIVACKKDDRPADRAASKPPVADAAPVARDATPVAHDAAAEPDEAALRKDRKTGLGAADERPEVLVEDLVAAIASGKVDAARFVDPARGYLEHVMLPGGDDTPAPEIQKRHCGKKAVKALVDEAKSLVALQRDGAKDGPDLADHVLQCDNRHLATPDPGFGARYDDDTDTLTGGHRLAYAVCRSGGAAEYDANYELVFVPDPVRGLRVVGSLTWESGVADVPWADFADDAVDPEGCE